MLLGPVLGPWVCFDDLVYTSDTRVDLVRAATATLVYIARLGLISVPGSHLAARRMRAENRGAIQIGRIRAGGSRSKAGIAAAVPRKAHRAKPRAPSSGPEQVQTHSASEERATPSKASARRSSLASHLGTALDSGRTSHASLPCAPAAPQREAIGIRHHASAPQ